MRDSRKIYMQFYNLTLEREREEENEWNLRVHFTNTKLNKLRRSFWRVENNIICVKSSCINML